MRIKIRNQNWQFRLLVEMEAFIFVFLDPLLTNAYYLLCFYIFIFQVLANASSLSVMVRLMKRIYRYSLFCVQTIF